MKYSTPEDKSGECGSKEGTEETHGSEEGAEVEGTGCDGRTEAGDKD